jgi:hypothetical protein
MTPSRTINNFSCSCPTSRNKRSSWVWTRLARPFVLSVLSTVLIPPAQSQAVQAPLDTFKISPGASQNRPAANSMKLADVRVPATLFGATKVGNFNVQLGLTGHARQNRISEPIKPLPGGQNHRASVNT